MNGDSDYLMEDPIQRAIRQLGLLNQIPQRPTVAPNPTAGLLAQAPAMMPQQPAAYTPGPTQTPGIVPQQPQQQQPDFASLLTETEEEKRKAKLLPLAMGLLGMGTGMMGGRWYPGYQDPPWVRGVQGLGTGVMSGMKMQQAQQDERLKQVKTLAELKKLYAQPEVKRYGNKDYLISPGHAPIDMSKPDALEVEGKRQEGREALLDKKQELQRQIEELKDARLDRRLTASEEALDKRLQAQMDRLDKQLESKGEKEPKTFHTEYVDPATGETKKGVFKAATGEKVTDIGLAPPKGTAKKPSWRDRKKPGEGTATPKLQDLSTDELRRMIQEMKGQ